MKNHLKHLTGGISKTLTTRIGAYAAGMQLTYDKQFLDVGVSDEN